MYWLWQYADNNKGIKSNQVPGHSSWNVPSLTDFAYKRMGSSEGRCGVHGGGEHLRRLGASRPTSAPWMQSQPHRVVRPNESHRGPVHMQITEISLDFTKNLSQD